MHRLRELRKSRGITQLELSFLLSVSQRHMSFVESGRAQASRPLLLRWLRTLRAPSSMRNEILARSGYAPACDVAVANAADTRPAYDALARLLDAHDPMPAFLLDQDWNILAINRGGTWLAATLAPDLMSAPASGSTPNMLDLMLHPQGFARTVLNLDEVGADLLVRLRDEALSHPPLSAHADRLAGMLRQRVGAHDSASRPPPVLEARFASPYGPLAFFSMFTTFGTPQDITLASLRVEHLFPADEATRTTLTRALGPSPQGTNGAAG